jgi:hypothetical protein
MKYEYYNAVYTADDLSIFEFVSVGKRGMVRKRIEFAKTGLKGIYNLAFGNISADGRLDDKNISDNGDRNRILATVAAAMDKYTQRYPRRWVYFRGNSPARTRLYRMAIGAHLQELSERFEIYVETEEDEEFVPFRKDLSVQGFIVRRRISFIKRVPEIL